MVKKISNLAVFVYTRRITAKEVTKFQTKRADRMILPAHYNMRKWVTIRVRVRAGLRYIVKYRLPTL